ncbi:MAG: hypothetical protein RLZZ574_552, partial [Cyanobacteriota bacterium]
LLISLWLVNDSNQDCNGAVNAWRASSASRYILSTIVPKKEYLPLDGDLAQIK